MKKGFTLIELLAVIVILAIIALIATPIVLNIISDSKESSQLRGAEFYLDAVENSVGKAMLNANKVQEGIYTIIENGNLCLELNKDKTCKEGFLEVDVSGNVPDKGRVTIKKGNISFAKLNYEGKNIIKDNNKIKYGDPICTLISGEKNEIGSKYQCKVKETMEEKYKDGYIFYVISYNTIDREITKNKEEAVSTNLILERNICKDGTLTHKDKNDKCTYEYISDEDYGCNIAGCATTSKGPLTAMKILDKAIEDWKEELRLDTYTTTIFGNKNFIFNSKARLPFRNELDHANGEKNVYLYENLKDSGDSWYGSNDYRPKEYIPNILGYWSHTGDGGVLQYAWLTYYNGSMAAYTVSHTLDFGIRPVIRVEL